MEDRLIDCLGLAVGLRVCHNSETRLAAQVVEIVREFTSVELPIVVKIMVRGMPRRVIMFREMNFFVLQWWLWRLQPRP